MESPRVLVAVRPEDVALVSAALEGHFAFTVRHTLRDATEALSDPYGLIVCGVHFDHGAMFDLLDAVKAHPTARFVPFFLVLHEESRHSKSVVEGIRSAAAIRGVDTFIELRELRERMDKSQMFEHLRNVVRDVLYKQD